MKYLAVGDMPNLCSKSSILFLPTHLVFCLQLSNSALGHFCIITRNNLSHSCSIVKINSIILIIIVVGYKYYYMRFICCNNVNIVMANKYSLLPYLFISCNSVFQNSFRGRNRHSQSD